VPAVVLAVQVPRPLQKPAREHTAAGDRDGEGVAVREGRRLLEREGERDGEGVGGLSEVLAEAVEVAVGSAEAVTLPERVCVLELVIDTDTEPLLLGVADRLPVPLPVSDAVPDVVGVLEPDAPVDRLAVAVDDGEPVLLGVCDGLPVPVPLPLPLGVPVPLPDGGGVSEQLPLLEAVALPLRDGVPVPVRVTLGVRAALSEAEALAVAEAVSEGAADSSGSTSFTL
jgi:hypothetical protein